jgi:hypothetical protein
MDGIDSSKDGVDGTITCGASGGTDGASFTVST